MRLSSPRPASDLCHRNHQGRVPRPLVRRPMSRDVPMRREVGMQPLGAHAVLAFSRCFYGFGRVCLAEYNSCSNTCLGVLYHGSGRDGDRHPSAHGNHTAPGASLFTGGASSASLSSQPGAAQVLLLRRQLSAARPMHRHDSGETSAAPPASCITRTVATKSWPRVAGDV